MKILLTTNKSKTPQFHIKIEFGKNNYCEKDLKNKTAISNFFKSRVFRLLLEADKGD